MEKTEQVPIPLPRSPRNFPDEKEMKKKFDNWALEIIPFI